MPQHVRGQLRSVHAGRCSARRRGQRRPQRVIADPRPRCRHRSCARRGTAARRGRVWSSSKWPHTSSITSAAPARAVDQRDHPLPRPRTAAPLPYADVQLPERAQLPLDVGQVEAADLVHAQPDLGHQPCRRVVPRRRGELAARRQLLRPAGEQGRDLVLRAAGSRSRASLPPRGRFISSTGHSTTRPVIACSSALCRSSRNSKYDAQRLRFARRVPFGAPRSTRPKYASASAGSISHSGRPNHARTWSRWPTSPGWCYPPAPPTSAQEQPGQHIGLEPLQLLRRRRWPARPQVRNRSNSQPTPLAFSPTGDLSILMTSLQESRSNFNSPSSLTFGTKRWPGRHAERLAGCGRSGQARQGLTSRTGLAVGQLLQQETGRARPGVWSIRLVQILQQHSGELTRCFDPGQVARAGQHDAGGCGKGLLQGVNGPSRPDVIRAVDDQDREVVNAWQAAASSDSRQVCFSSPQMAS